MFNLIDCANATKKASFEIADLSEKVINAVLKSSARLLRENVDKLVKENLKDIKSAKAKGLSDAFIDRLTLSDKVIEGMAVGIEQVASLSSPVGKKIYSYKNRAQKISIKKIAVPFGVIGIIYESRPNVTADAFALCFKTGNAVMLRGGSDAINSNKAIVSILKMALKENKVNENAVNLVENTTHAVAVKFMQLNGLVDLLIPRGGASLIDSALKNATVPVIETGKGNCHIYIDEFADIKKAINIVYNAKTQRYSVCNACESLVVHRKALRMLLEIVKKLGDKKVEVRCDEQSYSRLKGYKYLKRATEEDYGTEYCDAILSIKTVKSIEEGIEHINKYSTHHSECIITEDKLNAEKFLKNIDSACVYHNASTRFSDGFLFGFGAEIGISTQKLHARGPMGLDALVTCKYIVKGKGAVRK